MKQNELSGNGIDTNALTLDALGRIVIRDEALLNEIVGAGAAGLPALQDLTGGGEPPEQNRMCPDTRLF